MNSWIQPSQVFGRHFGGVFLMASQILLLDVFCFIDNNLPLAQVNDIEGFCMYN
jgi:hypothetical protein